ncbi:hypothetical protein [Neptuniibacter pectenicola]|uniref:hypothetical protein n=1 Tax=Neptuniibacter pectenicola TaxID=1806669 RepID=UPI0008379693|nr:hypothetical protein [Neptuniibacter pectenicola]
MEWFEDNWQWSITTIIALVALWIAYSELKLNKYRQKPIKEEQPLVREYESTDKLAFNHHVKVLSLRALNGLQILLVGGTGIMMIASYETHQKLWLGNIGIALIICSYLILKRLHLWDKYHKNRYK